jgi:ribonucleoside-diphosphate reductase alpha chain
MATLASSTPGAVSLAVKKRDGERIAFDARRIARAIEKAFRADAGLYDDELMPTGKVREIERLTAAVTDRCLDAVALGQVLEVEGIQDLVEQELMRAIHHGVARRYIIYREERRRAREAG